MPKSNIEFWRAKLECNRQRDGRNLEALASLGWHVLTLWECELQNIAELRTKIAAFLDGPG